MKPIAQTYHVTMETGMLLDIDAESAGEAIFNATHRVRGQKAIACFVGGEHDPATILLDGEGTGRVTFDVPKHEALPETPKPGRQKMAMQYVRVGDTFEEGPFEWEVEDITENPVKRTLGVRNVRDRNHVTEIKHKRDFILTVLRK